MKIESFLRNISRGKTILIFALGIVIIAFFLLIGSFVFINKGLKNPTIKKTKAQTVASIAKAKNLIVGNSFSCALLDNGIVKCWGLWANDGFYAFIPKEKYITHPNPVEIADNIKKVVSDGENLCMLKTDNKVKCFPPPLPSSSKPMEEITEVKDIVMGNPYGAQGVCALLINSKVKCNKMYGEWIEVLPDNTIELFGSTSGEICAVSNDGKVKCGFIGGSSFVVLQGINSPKAISLGYAILDPSAPSSYTSFGCALLQDDKIKCWGNNKYGQLGNGNNKDQDAPVEVIGINNAVKVVAGSNSACALLNDKSIKCWGKGGMLGGGDENDHNQPVKVIDINNAINLSIGRDATCALLENGQIRCWSPSPTYCFLSRYYHNDPNYLYQLYIPHEPLMEIDDAIFVDLDDNYSDPNGCALLSSGRIKCWGFNGYGQLGNGTIFNPTGLTAQQACPDLNRSAGPAYVIDIGASEVVKPDQVIKPTEALKTEVLSSPTETAVAPILSDTTLNLALKFQGISNKPAVSSMTVRVILASESGYLATQSAVFNTDEQGIWRGTIIFKNIVDSDNYRLKIKGSKQLQKVICEVAPKEEESGKYKCEKGTITLKQGDNKSFDFSNILQLSGDLPDENGLQDSRLTTKDLEYVLNNTLPPNSTNDKVLERADLNLDGVVNATDFSLIQATYSLQVEDQN